jgi:hypothetical protein
VLSGTGVTLIVRAKNSQAAALREQIAALREWSPQALRDMARASVDIYADRVKTLETRLASEKENSAAEAELQQARLHVEFLTKLLADIASFDLDQSWDAMPAEARMRFIEKLEDLASRRRFGAEAVRQANVWSRIRRR